MLIEGEIQRIIPNVSGGPMAAAMRLTHLGSMAVGQVEPPRFELSRSGKRFHLGNSAAITGIANVTALPTTAAQWVLWNNNSRRALVFEELGMYLTSGTPGVGGVLLACIFSTPAQTGAAVTGTSIYSASDGSAVTGVIVKNGVTITTPAAPTWYFVASNFSSNVTAFAASTFLEHRNLQGSIIVPPGRGLGLAVVAPAGTSPLFAPFAQWVEIETDLE